MTREQLIYACAGHLHAEQIVDAARLITAFTGSNTKQVERREVALEFCNSLLYWCLSNDKYEWAAELLWGERLFSYKPRATRLVWEEIKTSNSLLICGAASTSKSYGAGAWLLLDWIRDPVFTSVALCGPSEDHLKSNLFTHLVTLHSQASLQLPGQIGELFIGLDPRKRKGAIRGVVMPIGKRKAGRLQGSKRVPRPTIHPTLGSMSRMRIFLDELEKIPLGVWGDVDNLFANLDTDVDGFKIIGAFNPEDPQGQTAVRCEPEKGWEAFDPDNDERWVSKRGWRVLRLDAAKCENVVEKKLIYPGLQSYEGFQRIIQNAGGVDTPGYWTMARACFPRGGAIYSVIPSALYNKCKGELIFAEEPVKCASVDVALEGGDAPEMAVGRFGKALGVKYPPSLDHPQGQTVYFRDKLGKRRFRWGLQVDQIFTLPSADTVKMAERIRAECIRLGVSAPWLMLDRTGNGAGVHDLLKSLWNEEVGGVNYTEGATDRKIISEDTKTAKEEYERAVSELWFALKKWMEYGFVYFSPAALSDELSKELSGRRYMPGKLTRVESKTDYKSRGNGSPNKADALTLLLHGVRRTSGCVPSALDDHAGSVVKGDRFDGGPVPHYADQTNQIDYIEDDSSEWIE